MGLSVSLYVFRRLTMHSCIIDAASGCVCPDLAAVTIHLLPVLQQLPGAWFFVDNASTTYGYLLLVIELSD
jgi:hypothetical protein